MPLTGNIFRTATRTAAALSLALGALALAPARAGAAVVSTPAAAAAQCRNQDTVVIKQMRFGRGRTTGVAKDTVKLCTSHEYRLRANAGQTMSVNLATGRRTSMTIYAPTSGIIEGADGVKTWSGELTEGGEYTIQIGTDATARYTLEVTIR
jgi:hypothetical protein